MIDRHAVRTVVEAGSTTAEAARQFGLSQRTVQRTVREGELESADDAEARRARRVGRAPVEAGVTERIWALIVEDPQEPPPEILRQLREEGTELGTSTFYGGWSFGVTLRIDAPREVEYLLHGGVLPMALRGSVST